MERLLQYLDDLDDFVYAIALTWERIRTLFGLVATSALTVAVMALGIYAAIEKPPMAVAIAALLAVSLLYRAAVAGTRDAKAAT